MRFLQAKLQDPATDMISDHPTPSDAYEGGNGCALNCCCCGTRVGNTLVCCRAGGPEARRFPRACVIGPDWPCSVVTFTLVIVPAVFFLAFV